MIKFKLNGSERNYDGNPKYSLLKYLREVEGIISVKDGCSGQSTCGTCMVEMDGKPLMSCSAPMSKVQGTEIITIEGFPADLRTLLGRAFVEKGAVQCGFCTPGFLSRTQILLKNNPNPTRRQIIDALRFNLCRCTGYVKIVEAIEYAATLKLKGAQPEVKIHSGKVGTRYPKYEAFETAIGIKPFVCDMKFPGMLYGALKFSDHPRARVIKINTTEAEKLEGVVKVFSAKDIPGNKKVGLIVQDWDLMISEGEITRYVGDVIVGIVAISEEVARYAVSLIKIDYEILHPLLNVFEAEKSNIKIHEKGNVLDVCVIKRGLEAETAIKQSDYVVKHQFSTQLIEHGFLEPECAISLPDNGGVKIYSQSQGVYEDQKQIASLLNLPLEKVNVIQVSNGGGFGGKEDMSVQGHSALFAYHLNKPVKVTLSREESIIMHPKRHPIIMNYTVGCDKDGLLTIVAADITGDTGAYASVGMKVLERAAGHSTGAYYVPSVDVIAKTIYTNNLPCGAMRGFGVPQTAFAMEVCIDELCELGGFDRWKFRYDNALTEGKMTTTGQILRAGVGVRKTLEAVKDKFYESKYSGIACGIKNTGVGNGMPDFSIAKIEIKSKDHIIIHHGWTEMGQGVHTMALQTFCQETGISPEFVEVMVDTKYTALSGMTTASRATSLVGNAVIESCKLIKKDLETLSLENLVGKTYVGKWICDWTTKPGMEGEAITHYSYSYATQLVILDDNGKIYKVYAAHDAGKIMNPTLFEGQIEGSISMGLGYALTEDLPLINGKPVSTKIRDCGMYLAKDMPEVEVIGIEVRDPYGPYGAKGVGEIGLVPTAGAVANALYQYDKIRRFKLPLMRKGKKV